MRKFLVFLSLGLLLAGSTPAFASPVADFEKGTVTLETGSTLNSKVRGTGPISAEVNGKSGFKSALTLGLSNKYALQYKHGRFKSEDSTILGLTTYAEDKLQDFNLLYKLHPDLALVAGYEKSSISYGNYVAPADQAALHFGLAGTHKIADNLNLFANLIGGNHVSLKEIGLAYKLSNIAVFKVSYAEREIRNVDLKVPLLHREAKENYKMTGITCIFAFQL
jgi:hypothetical protein